MDRQQAVDLVRGLVAIPSLSHQEARATAWLVQQIRNAGYERAFLDAAGNAVGEIGALDAPRTLVLLGHIDTVRGHIPVRIEPSPAGDLLFGRGSVDAKGPLAAFVAAAARLDGAWARERGIRIVVVGAVEEEAATSRGARFIADRFDGKHERVPDACIVGEPSRWHRITLGYKGRLLLDLAARQPMAHTAGPDPGIASAVVDLWNWIVEYAAAFNQDRGKPFDEVVPSLRRFITGMAEMDDTVDAEIAWRLPLGFDPDTMTAAMLTWAAGRVRADEMVEALRVPVGLQPGAAAQPRTIAGPRTALGFRFRGFEHPWRGDRQNALVRSLLGAIRAADASAQPGFVLKTGTSDMNVVAPLWRCPIVAYGPGDSSLDHTPNEHLSLDEYWRTIDVIETAIRTLGES